VSDFEPSNSVQPASLVRKVAPSNTAAFPGLERIGERLARGLTQTLRRIAGDVSVTVEAVRVEGLSDWHDMLLSNTVSAKIRLSPLSGSVVIVLPHLVIMQLVDIHYGGTGDVGTARKQLSGAEQRLVTRLANSFCDIIPAAWHDVIVLKPQLADVAMSNSRPALSPDNVQIAIQTFQLSVAGQKHSVECLYPAAMLRMVPQLIMPAREDEEEAQVDPAWQSRMSEAVMQVRMPVRTIFARPEVPFSRLMTLKPGEVIPICLPNLVPVTVGGRQFATASVGEANGRVAIKVEKIEEGISL
jgi:flagellar motor switch protein FliM